MVFHDITIANSSDIITVDFGLRNPNQAVRNCTICDTVTEIPTAQCESLVALYDSTGGDNWTNNDNWKQTNTPCTVLPSITLAVTNRQVTDIALENNFKSESLP